MRLVCHLRAIRERRGLNLPDVESASGINRGTLSSIENGRLLPLERQVEPMERAYGASRTDWYSPTALLAIQEDEQA